MKITREQLSEMLRGRGDHELADRAVRELPAEIDSRDLPSWAGDFDLDAEDAGRHAGTGASEDMTGLPTSG